MDLLFDARLLHRGLSGIERVQRNLLRELSELEGVERLRALVSRDTGRQELDLPERVELVEVAHTDDILSILLSGDKGQRPEVYLLSYFPDRHPRDVFLPAAAPASVVVVHDAILNRHPEYHPSPAEHAWYHRFVQVLLSGSDRILCFSQSSGQEAVNDLGCDPSRIDVSPLAADPTMLRPLEADEVKRRTDRLGIQGSYFVALGKDYPHKDHPTLFRALARLPRQAHLICCGTNVFPHEKDGGETLEQIQQRLGITERVRWIPGLEDDDVKAVLQGSLGLVYPSLEEGFGLPPLEAMALGVPVVAAASMSIPEVCGEGALFFEAGQAEQLASHMTSLLDGGPFVREQVDRGLARAHSYSWKRTAEGALESCRQAIASASSGNKARPPLTDLLTTVVTSPYGDPADLEACREEWRLADRRCRELEAECRHLERTVQQVRRLVPRWSLRRRLDKLRKLIGRR